MKKMYFKIQVGYDQSQYIEINEDELEKAYYCFLHKKDSLFSGGAVKGENILYILPDYHRIMGWNKGWKLTIDDEIELKEKKISNKCRDLISSAQEKVKLVVKEDKTDLIGKTIERPKEFEDMTKKLSNKFSVNKS